MIQRNLSVLQVPDVISFSVFLQESDTIYASVAITVIIPSVRLMYRFCQKKT